MKKINDQRATLLALRKKFNLSQNELAEKVNVSKKDISRWENGHHALGLPTFLEWCRVLGVKDMNDILKE